MWKKEMREGDWCLITQRRELEGGGGRVHDIFHRNDFTRCIFHREGQEGMGY